MNCRRARAAIESRGFSDRISDQTRALDRHLEHCPTCAAVSEADDRLVRDLGLLRGQIPYAIDIRSRVMLEIGRLGPVDRSEVPAWQLGWAAAVAGLGVTGLVGLMVSLWSGLLSGLGTVTVLLGGLAELVGKLLSALFSLLALPVKLATSLKDLWIEIPAALSSLEPFAIAALAVCYLIMGATIIHVVGRDLRHRVKTETHEESR
jgi:hypothetical protein